MGVKIVHSVAFVCDYRRLRRGGPLGSISSWKLDHSEPHEPQRCVVSFFGGVGILNPILLSNTWGNEQPYRCMRCNLFSSYACLLKCLNPFSIPTFSMVLSKSVIYLHTSLQALRSSGFSTLHEPLPCLPIPCISTTSESPVISFHLR